MEAPPAPPRGPCPRVGGPHLLTLSAGSAEALQAWASRLGQHLRDHPDLVRRYLGEGNNPDQPGRLIEWLYPQTPVYTWRLPGRWYDIGSTETLEEADRIFSNVPSD